MGRQVVFHMLPEDTQMFLDFVQEHDPVVITLRDSNSPVIEMVSNPVLETRTLTFWNKALLNSLGRKHYVHPAREYFHIDSSLPTLEFSQSELCEWNGSNGLRQGRIYGTFENSSMDYEKWYNAIARWIRKNFVKNPVELGGYIGPSTLKWFQNGGNLLPIFQPPLTKEWLLFMEKQESVRKSI